MPAREGGRAVDRSDTTTMKPPCCFGDLDTEAVELAARVDLHLVEGVLAHEGRVRVEIAEQPAQRALHQVVLVHRLDVVAADEVEHAREESQVLVARGRARWWRRRSA